MATVSAAEFSLWSHYIYTICGIQLDSSKGYLIETRLRPLMQETGCANFTDLYGKVKSDFTTGFRKKVIDAITTRETSFFRDTSPFELLQHKVIPDLIDKRAKAMGNGSRLPIRIWSAACSTGQEVYSTAIVLKELLVDLTRYDIRILGTDISDKAIAQASYGRYSKLEMDRGMPAQRMSKYFQQDKEGWRIRDEIRALALFKTMNLLEPFAFPQKFDIIFCRNVAIYFSEQDKTQLFRALSKTMAPDGYLIIGSTESIAGLCPELEPKRYLRSVFYQLKP
ncbi:MAG: CheR family methyltransferase [Syntrophobacteraceae bacterium]